MPFRATVPDTVARVWRRPAPRGVSALGCGVVHGPLQLPRVEQLAGRVITEPGVRSKNRKLVIGSRRRDTCANLSPLNGTPPTHSYNVGQKAHSFAPVCSVNSAVVLCAGIGGHPRMPRHCGWVPGLHCSEPRPSSVPGSPEGGSWPGGRRAGV